MAKVLIIKTGYSETFHDGKWERVSSLGDVLRTTPLLHLYKNDEVTWLTDEKAVPLLEGNPYIKRVLIWDALTLVQLQHECFDVVVNLEKVPGLAALADNVLGFYRNKPTRHGYWFDEHEGEVGGHIDKADWQDALFEVVGAKYSGEEYVLGYAPKTITNYFDIGFNYQVGSKWPEKAWAYSLEFTPNRMNFWYDLHYRLGKYFVQYQPLSTTIYDYIDWINGCKCLVTCDSLGLHIAIALKKKVVSLFGPTPVFKEAYGKGREVIISKTGHMQDIAPEMVKNAIDKVMEEK